MNFKTTIALLIALVCVGAFVFLTRDKGPQETPKPSEHKLLSLDSTDLVKVKITAADGSATVLEQADKKWRLTAPVNAPADTFEVGSVLSSITGLTSTAQVPTSGSDAPQTGLDQPQFKIELSTASKTTTLLVGNRLAVSESVYVQVAGQKQADVVPVSFVEKLDSVAKTVRDKKLVDVASNFIEQLVLSRPEGRVVLNKVADKWEIVEPIKVAADASSVSNLLAALTSLKAVDFEQTKTRSTGLTAPVLSIFYSTQTPATQPAGPTTAPAAAHNEKPKTVISDTIRFGDYADARQKNVFAQVGAASGATASAAPVARVTADSFNNLNKTAAELRDKTVVDITPAEVNQFSIKTDTPATTQPTTQAASSNTITIVHRPTPLLPGSHATTHPVPEPFNLRVSPGTPWAFGNQSMADASDVDATALLGALHPLKAEKFLDKPSTDKPIAQYLVTVTAIGPGGAPVTDYAIEVVDSGQNRPLEGHYNGLVFELPRTLLKTLTADFVDRPGKTPPAPPPAPSMGEPADGPAFPPGQ